MVGGETQGTGALRLDLALRSGTRSGTTDVEGAHGQLRAGLTDRLGGNDTDRLAGIDQGAATQDHGRSTWRTGHSGFRR